MLAPSRVRADEPPTHLRASLLARSSSSSNMLAASVPPFGDASPSCAASPGSSLALAELGLLLLLLRPLAPSPASCSTSWLSVLVLLALQKLIALLGLLGRLGLLELGCGRAACVVHSWPAARGLLGRGEEATLEPAACS